MPIQQPSFNLNDPDLYVVPKQLFWNCSYEPVSSGNITWDFIVPEGHFWEVMRLTATSDSASPYFAYLILSSGDNYYDTDYDTTNQESATKTFVGYADTPIATSAADNPYPGSCIVFADRNLPLYLISGTRLQVVSQAEDAIHAYMAYKDYQY